MKTIKNFLLVLPLFLGSFLSPNHRAKTIEQSYEKDTANGILLVYTGSMSGPMNLNIGVHIEIDSLIGFRYGVAFLKGSNVVSHMALFYKFSNPFQSVVYDFNRQKSIVTKCCESSGDDSKLVVMGSATIDSFSCTYLQRLDKSPDRSREMDLWMSPDVPGLLTVAEALNNAGAQMIVNGLNKTAFHWGGLVRMTIINTDKNGNNVVVKLKLFEANSNMTFPSTDFDVPSD